MIEPTEATPERRRAVPAGADGQTATPQGHRLTDRETEPAAYLSHGIASLVAQDNPDDSQLGAEPATQSDPDGS